jgi:endonuclease/exonuclease/phosphatase family metal-dependent hydrolase
VIRETTLRVVTWNVWLRFGPWRRRQTAIESTLAGLAPDIVALQEVWREPGGTDQARLLGEALEMYHHYSHCSTLDGLEIGNAVLSRWPITCVEELVLPGPRDSGERRRCVTLARISGPRGDVPFCTTHLAHDYADSGLRQQQARAVARFVACHANGGFPSVLAGDLNADPTCDEVRMLTGRCAVPVPGLVFHDAWDIAGSGDGHTWSNDNPHARSSPVTSDRLRTRRAHRPPWSRPRRQRHSCGREPGRRHGRLRPLRRRRRSPVLK